MHSEMAFVASSAVSQLGDRNSIVTLQQEMQISGSRVQCQAPADIQYSFLPVPQAFTELQEESMNYDGTDQHPRSSLITTSHLQWDL